MAFIVTFIINSSYIRINKRNNKLSSLFYCSYSTPTSHHNPYMLSSDIKDKKQNWTQCWPSQTNVTKSHIYWNQNTKKHSTRPQTTNKLIEWNFPFVWSLRCATDPLSSKKFNQFSCNKANLKSLHWEAEKGETKWNWWNFLKTTLETPFLLFAERTLYIVHIYCNIVYLSVRSKLMTNLEW